MPTVAVAATSPTTTVLGTVLAAALTGTGPTFVLPASHLAVYLVVSVAAAMLAATVPARRAARMGVLAAITTE